MKSMDLFARPGANRSHSRSYGEKLQRGMADKDAISCKGFGETEYRTPHLCPSPARGEGENQRISFIFDYFVNTC
jgi:hypothetical protein